MQNQQTGRIEQLTQLDDDGMKELQERLKRATKNIEKYHADIVRLDGSPVSKNEIVFRTGELVEIKGYTYRLVYLNEKTLIFEPVKPEDALTAGDGKEE